MGSSDTAHYIDLKALVDRQRGERYRSLLILAEDAGKRSRQARRLAKGLGAHYLNVLDTFEERPELCACIDRFGIDELENLLLNLEVPHEVVVVDAIDFLLNTWHKEQRESFTWILLDQRLDTLERDAKLFVFFALEDIYLRQHELSNTEGERRILRLSEMSF
ncbi:MAG: hypothetical protein U9R72_04000 [Chloroflexota bacterium]|nr:hypothetical protein [Chloroflexota bacterium]